MEAINYGQLVKEREGGRVVGKIRTIIFGEIDDVDIDTVYIERYILTLRHGILPPFGRSLILLILNLFQHQNFLYLNLFITFLYLPRHY